LRKEGNIMQEMSERRTLRDIRKKQGFSSHHALVWTPVLLVWKRVRFPGKIVFTPTKLFPLPNDPVSDMTWPVDTRGCETYYNEWFIPLGMTETYHIWVFIPIRYVIYYSSSFTPFTLNSHFVRFSNHFQQFSHVLRLSHIMLAWHYLIAISHLGSKVSYH
jgi:hypothetical protein